MWSVRQSCRRLPSIPRAATRHSWCTRRSRSWRAPTNDDDQALGAHVPTVANGAGDAGAIGYCLGPCLRPRLHAAFLPDSARATLGLRLSSSAALSSAACHDMFVWSAAALYPFYVSLCVMSRGILCTGSLDVICHASVCGRGVSGVCETCATFWPTKWQYRPRNGSTFPLRSLLRKDFSLQRGGSARKNAHFSTFSRFSL